jgi:von Willebrand factor type A domain
VAQRRWLKAAIVAVLVAAGAAALPAASATPASSQDPVAPQAAEPFELMFTLDGSGSISPPDFDLERLFAKRVLQSCLFTAGARAGVIQFSSQGETELRVGLTSEASLVADSLDSMEQLGNSTDIEEGLAVAQGELAAHGRPGVKRFVILLTDGAQTEPGDPVAQAAAMKAAATEIFTIGVGTGTDPTTLQDIASAPKPNHVFAVTDFDSLAASLGSVVGAVCGGSPIIPGKYNPIEPVRALDTREGKGGPAGKVAADGVVQLQISGFPGIPTTAVGVLLNTTVTQTDGSGFLTVWGCGAQRPTVSNLNYTGAGDEVANLVAVRIGVGGKVCLSPGVSAAHLVADISGYFAADGSLYNPVAPFRAADTRRGPGPVGPVAANGVYELQVTGSNGVPADATAVMLNATVDQPDRPGFLTVWPCGTPRPVASNLNYVTGETVPGLVAVKIGTGGKVCFSGFGQSEIVADIVGWFGSTGSLYETIFPVRAEDTRRDFGPLDPGNILTLDVVSPLGGVGGIPPSATGVVVNVTVADPVAAGFLTVFPCGSTPPVVSNLNYVAGQTVPNLVAVKLGPDGSICFSTFRQTEVIADVVGYFTT